MSTTFFQEPFLNFVTDQLPVTSHLQYSNSNDIIGNEKRNNISLNPVTGSSDCSGNRVYPSQHRRISYTRNIRETC